MAGESKVTVVTSKAEWEQALVSAEGKAVIVDFSATWNGPCKMIKPNFEALSIEFGNVVFLSIDMDQVKDVAVQCRVKSIPTFQVYKDGNKVEELVGANPYKLRDLVQKYA